MEAANDSNNGSQQKQENDNGSQQKQENDNGSQQKQENDNGSQQEQENAPQGYCSDILNPTLEVIAQKENHDALQEDENDKSSATKIHAAVNMNESSGVCAEEPKANEEKAPKQEAGVEDFVEGKQEDKVRKRERSPDAEGSSVLPCLKKMKIPIIKEIDLQLSPDIGHGIGVADADVDHPNYLGLYEGGHNAFGLDYSSLPACGTGGAGPSNNRHQTIDLNFPPFPSSPNFSNYGHQTIDLNFRHFPYSLGFCNYGHQTIDLNCPPFSYSPSFSNYGHQTVDLNFPPFPDSPFLNLEEEPSLNIKGRGDYGAEVWEPVPLYGNFHGNFQGGFGMATEEKDIDLELNLGCRSTEKKPAIPLKL